jgi:hypothetical protein
MHKKFFCGHPLYAIYLCKSRASSHRMEQSGGARGRASTFFTFVIAEAPGGQLVYVATNDALGFTPAHSAAYGPFE